MKTNTIFLRICILGVLAIFLIAGNVNATVCYCSDCTICNTQLNNVSCDIVELNTNITNQTGTCINNPLNFTNKVFDCHGHTIEGTRTDYGIYLDSKQNNTIKNCVITEFGYGIYLVSSSNNTITDDTANKNYGIYFNTSNFVGKYEKMGDFALNRDFYSSSGVPFDALINYKQGSWKDYNISCTVKTAMAKFPRREEMCNEICSLCYNISQEEIKHINHTMEEEIIVDANNIRFYEDGLGDSVSEALKMRVEGGSLKYHVKLDGIPISTLRWKGDLVDGPYRGKMLFIGSNDYYVKGLDASGPSITLAKGKKLTINTEGFSEDFKGYTFKVAGFLGGSSECGSAVAGVLITIQKPDGSTVTVQATDQMNALLPEGIEIQVFNAQSACEIAGQGAGYGTADIIVYEDNTQLTLENNKNFEGWSVEIMKAECKNVGITDYSYDNGVRYCLTDLTLTLNDEVVLGVDDDPLYFPTNAVNFSFEGYKTDDFKDITCSGGSDKIKIQKSGDSKLMLSFTDRDGNRYNDVRLDQGKFNTGNLFMFNGRVYEYSELKTETSGGITTYKLILKDEFDASDVELIMTRRDGPVGNYGYVTFSGKENNGKSTTDSILAGTGTYYDCTYNGFIFVVKSGSLYILDPANTKIGVNPAIVGTLSASNREKDDNGLNIRVVEEYGTTDLNGDDQGDDTLILFEPENGDDVFIDFYDAGKDTRTTLDWYTGISITKDSSAVYTATCGTQTCGVAKIIGMGDDTLLIDEKGGGTYTKNANKELTEVTICHPTTEVYPTYFIGTNKSEITQEEIYKCNGYGIYIVNSTGNKIVNNTANTNNDAGIYLSSSSNNNIDTNSVCNNSNSDFYSDNWLSSYGDNNTCDNPDGWNDTGSIGCSNPCDSTTKNYSIPLNVGWNLVSIPLTPKNTSIKSVLASIEGSYTKVGAWVSGSGKHYIPGFPFNTLNSIDEKMGFWIKMNQSDVLVVEGYEPVNRSIPLQVGWNLVGYLSTNKTQPLTTALSSISGKYTKVGAWINGTGKHYIPGFPFNTLINMSEGYGYWIKMNASGVLAYV